MPDDATSLPNQETVEPFAIGVDGVCPGCGQHTLTRYRGGHITCSLLSCQDPTAVQRILDIEEFHHLVEFREHDFRIIHPLLERAQDDPFEMFDCDLHQWLSEREGPPRAVGRYRAIKRGDGSWGFIPVEPSGDAR